MIFQIINLFQTLPLREEPIRGAISPPLVIRGPPTGGQLQGAMALAERQERQNVRRNNGLMGDADQLRHQRQQRARPPSPPPPQQDGR